MGADQGVFGLEVSMAVHVERSPLLSAASVLHRRGIEVIEASLSPPSVEGSWQFAATFRSGPVQARTLLRSFGNLIGTTDAVLVDFADGSRMR